MIKIIRKPVQFSVIGGNSSQRSGDTDQTDHTGNEHSIWDQSVHDTRSVAMVVLPPHEYLRISPSVYRRTGETHTLPGQPDKENPQKKENANQEI